MLNGMLHASAFAHTSIQTSSPDPVASDYSPARFDDGILLDSALRLRCDVFCEELGWVEPTSADREYDVFDGSSVNLGLVCQGEVAAYLRLTPGPGPFMIDTFFSHLLADGIRLERSDRVAELSRLCVHRDHRSARFESPRGAAPLSLMLYREAYRWCQEEGVERLYFVTTPRVARLVSLQYFPIRALARFDDGREGQVLAALDWADFHRKAPAPMREWFRRGGEAASTAAPKPLLGLCS
jgi:N-acyl-L-homoserine lactone synthetase